jgi:hypothetical protein
MVRLFEKYYTEGHSEIEFSSKSAFACVLPFDTSGNFNERMIKSSKDRLFPKDSGIAF